MNNFFKELVSAVFPSKCPICRYVSEQVPCGSCRQTLVLENFHFVSPAPFVDEVRSAYAYQQAEPFVRALKFHRETSLVEFMASEISKLVDEHYPDITCIIPVPIHNSRLAWRGFNQAAELTSKIASEKIIPDLVRIRKTKPQWELTPEERASNLRGAIKCNRSLQNEKVLLVDDVFTTGATASACAQALKESGASYVAMVTFSAAP